MNNKIYESPMFELLQVQVEDCLAISRVSGDPEGDSPETPKHEEVETMPDDFFDGFGW